MANGIIVTLLPDAAYVSRRPEVHDAHLTMAYLGTLEEKSAAFDRFKSVVDIIARQTPVINAKVNGMGIFSNPGEIASVDLIDAYELTNVRSLIERAIGADINHNHGFTPHMTRDIAPDGRIQLDIDASEVDVFDFQFVRVALWAGNFRYEVALQKEES